MLPPASTLFMSDLHLGSSLCKAAALGNFLADYPDRQRIYLIGDVFDDVTSQYLPPDHIEVVELLLSFAEAIWLPGNHDHFMRKLVGLDISRFRIANEGFYLSPFSGKRYFLTHGDRFDPTL